MSVTKKKRPVRKKTLLEQTAVLTGSNVAVRALGFAMRIWFSRVMGAEALGIMELSTSAHLLWITPVTSGLPLVLSRAVAQAEANGDHAAARKALYAARRLVLRISALMLPILFVASPWIARLLGDDRTLPSLWAYLPCLPILGLSAAYNGYCYGIGTTVPQSTSEVVEQGLRFALSATLFYCLHNATIAWTAAFPAIATAVGEGIGVVLAALMVRATLKGSPTPPDRKLERTLFARSLPMTCTRLVTTVVRTLSAIIIPLRLRASGLLAMEATARLGMLQGMALPLVMMPSVFTGALAMVSAPALAARQRDPVATRRLVWRLLPASLLISAAAMAVIYYGADFFSRTLYHQAELSPLLHALAPLVPLFGVQQVASSMLAGLGMQRKAMQAALAGSVLSLALTWLWAAVPSLRLMGCVYAMMAGQGMTLLLNLSNLFGALRKH